MLKKAKEAQAEESKARQVLSKTVENAKKTLAEEKERAEKKITQLKRKIETADEEERDEARWDLRNFQRDEVKELHNIESKSSRAIRDAEVHVKETINQEKKLEKAEQHIKEKLGKLNKEISKEEEHIDHIKRELKDLKEKVKGEVAKSKKEEKDSK